MAATERLIERMGGGGTVGLAVAAVALAPTVIPPLRRGLRGLAKVAIIQYLRAAEIQRQRLAPAVGGATATAPPERAGRRGRPRGTGNASAAATPAPEAPQPRGRRGRAATGTTAEPAPAVAATRAPRQTRGQAAAPAAETPPARAPRRPRAQTAAAAETPPPAAPARAPRQRRAETAAAPAPPPAEQPQPAARQGRGGGEAGNGKINLNTATRAELSRLPRVGAQTADRIIQYREQNGPIRNIRQLRQADIIPVSAARGMRDQVRF
jgi:competence ComEA-like helix-hairpin-helix protein